MPGAWVKPPRTPFHSILILSPTQLDGLPLGVASEALRAP